MLQNFFSYVESGALDWVFWTVVAYYLFVAAINRVRKKSEKRRLVQLALEQWLASNNGMLILSPAYSLQQEEELWKVVKSEFRFLIFPLIPFLAALTALYFCRWWMGWSIPVTIGVLYVSFFVGIIIAVWIIRALPNKENAQA